MHNLAHCYQWEANNLSIFMTPFNNPQLKLAHDFVQYTGRNVFLTGKAGTGKTTFLHNLKESSTKRMIVVAPTGVAAINAGGVTIHSFFQLPFGPQLPNDASNNFSKADNSKIRRFSKEKINIIRSLDLLVIDEISMVRADLLDGIDGTLRRFRNRNLPFGGVQLLLIGDLQQLAPVVKESEWSLLRSYYDTVFFFSSTALQKTNYVSIELTHVYRQSDQEFIKLLNNVRNNSLDTNVIDELNKRYNPNFDSLETDHIILTTHNYKAKDINESRLKKLPGKVFRYQASTTGNFPEYSYPTDFELVLKNGAQVMFIKNDPNPEKRYFNGKIGIITGISSGSISISCKEDEEPIIIEKLFWEKVKYTLDDNSKEIVESIEGTFVQYPIKLAWAITIHKSQGLTFEHAVIDAQSAFAHGQVYVALSRCKTLEGLVLSSKILTTSVVHDNTVGTFSKEIEDNQPNETILSDSKKQFQRSLLLDLFDFITIQKLVFYAIKLFQEHYSSVINNPIQEFTDASQVISNEIVKVSMKFKRQVATMCEEDIPIEDNPVLQQRIAKGSEYFILKLKLALASVLEQYILETDNKVARKSIKKILSDIGHEYAYKMGCLTEGRNGFNVESYLVAKAHASMDDTVTLSKKKPQKIEATGDENPELYRILKAWRDAKAAELEWQVYRVIQLKTMREICKDLPTNPIELNRIIGMGKKKVELFSDELLDIINDFRGEYGISDTKNIEVEEISAMPKKNTREISLEMWKSGSTLMEIASKRELALTTIEGHLAHYIGCGKVKITDFVNADRVDLISDFIIKNDSEGLKEIKENINGDVSYSEIKFVIQHLMFNKKNDY